MSGRGATHATQAGIVPAEEILLVYDRQCPFCDAYCRLVRIRESVGELRIVDARSDSGVMREITQLGLDIDEGMVLKMGGRVYYGADAMHTLALISSRSGVFNRINYQLFKSARLSAVFYPVLRWFRNLALKIMGKDRINNLGKPDNESF